MARRGLAGRLILGSGLSAPAPPPSAGVAARAALRGQRATTRELAAQIRAHALLCAAWLAFPGVAWWALPGSRAWLLTALCLALVYASALWLGRVRGRLPLPAFRDEPDDARDPWSASLASNERRIAAQTVLCAALLRVATVAAAASAVALGAYLIAT